MAMDPLLAAAGGSGITALLLKFILSKFISDFSEIGKKVGNISETLASILVRLERLTEHDSIIKEHSKKIAYFEGLRSGKKN